MKTCALVVLGLALTVGCSDGDGDDAPRVDPINLDYDSDLEGETLAACTSADQADANAALGIVQAFGEAVRKVGPVGKEISAQADAVFDMTTFFLEGKNAVPAAPFTYKEGGDYVLSVAQSEVTLQFILAGKKIEPNLLDPESYVRGLTVSGPPDAPTFTFDEAGPLFALLAPDAEAQSPLTFTVQDVAQLVDRFRALGLAGLVTHTSPGNATASYELAMQGLTVNDALFDDLDMQVLTATATDALGQTLTVTDGDLRYSGNSSAAAGTLHAEVEGPQFGYEATLVFIQDDLPEIEIGCAE